MSANDQPVDEAQVTAFLAAVTGLLTRFKLEPGLLADSIYSDLHHNDIGLLTTLEQLGPATVRAIALALGAPDSTISSALDRLERRDLVDRTPSATDRRSVVVSLTSAGEVLVAQLIAIQRDNCRAMLASIAAPDRATLLAIAGRILGN